MVKTRFAPSPTGSLHVGGVRTAFFSWLFARHHGGQFVLRIEDTDKERSTQESVNAILDGLRWLGLNSDEPIVYQTQRFDRYEALANQLLESGHAYRCYCSKERLEALRTVQMAAKEKPRYDGHCRDLNLSVRDEAFVIRFKNPQVGVVRFTDSVYGEIVVSNQELDDLVIVRSDGYPTYNFAVVIDDWDMGITHIIRGDDHINNTPRQINLFQALGAPVPAFAHLPMILGADGKRLSKRHGAVSVMEFHRAGYLPHTLLNYLVRLGWSNGDQEIFTLDEMIQKFDLQQVSRGSASFNYDKLQWLNQYYLKNDPIESIVSELTWHYQVLGIDVQKGPALDELVPLFAERCKTLAEMAEKSRYFFDDAFEIDMAAFEHHVAPIRTTLVPQLLEALTELDQWDTAHIHACLKSFSDAHGIGMGKIAQPLRILVTGSTNSPSIDVTLALLGREVVRQRIERGIED